MCKHAHTHTHARTCTHAHMHAHIYIHAYTCAHMHTFTRTCNNVHAHTHTPTRTRTHMQHTHVPPRIQTHTCMHIYSHVHANTHTALRALCFHSVLLRSRVWTSSLGTYGPARMQLEWAVRAKRVVRVQVLVGVRAKGRLQKQVRKRTHPQLCLATLCGNRWCLSTSAPTNWRSAPSPAPPFSSAVTHSRP